MTVLGWFFFVICAAIISIPIGMLIRYFERLREKQSVNRWRVVSTKATGTREQRNLMVKAIVHGEPRLFVGRVMEWKRITDYGLEAAPTWVEAKLFDVWHDYHEGTGVQLAGNDERAA